MSGVGSVVVGYRREDRMKLRDLELNYGLRAFRAGKCINCRHEVCYVQSGADAIRNRDPQLICDVCWDEPDVKQAIYAEL